VPWVWYEMRSGTLAIIDIDPNWQPRDTGPSIALEVDDFDVIMTPLRYNGFTICVDKIDTPVCEIRTIQNSEGNMITIYSKKAVCPEFSNGFTKSA